MADERQNKWLLQNITLLFFNNINKCLKESVIVAYQNLFCVFKKVDGVVLYRVSQKKRPAFERLLLPEYISNDILQYLIE